MSYKYQAIKISVISFCEGDPNENPWVNGKPDNIHIDIVPYSPRWTNIFIEQKRRIQQVLNEKIINIEHIGSTAVKNLAAKPIIDIDLIVEDPTNEDSYLPQLTTLGYELTVREPSWYQHRMLQLASPRVNLHIFGIHCAEHIRHILFRNWLQSHPKDRELYAKIKQSAKIGVNTTVEYNQNKNQVVKQIYQHIFNNIDNCMQEINLKSGSILN